MQKNVREKDLKLFIDMSREPPPATPEDFVAAHPGAGLHDIRAERAFEIGFLLFLPS